VYRTVLVDDVASLRLLYRTVLERSGRFVVVGEAGTGDDAVSLAGQLRPDLMLLDVSMPGRDGIEALPEVLRASPASRVVMLSGFEARRLAGLATDRGACAYLEKGITPAQLVAELLAILRNGGVNRPAPGP
jgi:DNA-binding NarL/FixJ family response regulator